MQAAAAATFGRFRRAWEEVDDGNTVRGMGRDWEALCIEGNIFLGIGGGGRKKNSGCMVGVGGQDSLPYRRRGEGDGGGGGGAELGVLLKTVCGVASSPPRCQAKKTYRQTG